MEVTADLASKLATDVFNRIERERLCQKHIIEDELRCRLKGNEAAMKPPSVPIVEEAKKLLRLWLYFPHFFPNTDKQVGHQFIRLLSAFNKEGHIV